jgi:hypothetical protein
MKLGSRLAPILITYTVGNLVRYLIYGGYVKLLSIILESYLTLGMFGRLEQLQ